MAGDMSDRVVGRNVPRIEDPPLIRGTGRYVDDIAVPGMLHAAFVRSPFAHARIGAIDTSMALEMAGVHGVYTLDDLRPHLTDTLIRTALPSPSFQESRHRPVLAESETVHVGEAVAIVLAETRHIAEDAAAAVMVDFDPLPAAGDLRAAMEDGAPAVHSDAKHNIAADFTFDFGDVQTAFANAAHVFAETLSMHRGVAHSLECRGVVAVPDLVEDRLSIWSSTQTPHVAKRIICELLALSEDKVRVAIPDIGGGFGPKLVFYSEELVVPLVARLTGRPVKWIEDRREHFLSTTQERDEIWEMEIAVDGEARILGVRGRLLHDNGAYMVRGVNVPYGAAATLPLAYVIPALDLNIVAVSTNKVPVTPIRGAGKPQGVFVMERLMDKVAREMGLDRAEVRRRNLVARSQIPYPTPLKTRGGMAVTLDAGDYPGAQAAALEKAGWATFRERQEKARSEGRYIGIGLANYVEGTGRGPYEPVSVRVAEDGRIHVATGAAAIGQSTKTMLAQIVAEQLGGDMENITVVCGDTAAIPLGMGTFNSRQAVIAGNAAHASAMKVREKMLKAAAAMLDVGEQALEIEGRFVSLRGDDAKKLGFGEISRALAGLPGYFLPGGLDPGLFADEKVIIDDMTYSNGTGVVEVEVDVETGLVHVARVTFAHDCGNVIHPAIVDGQLMGGIAHGLGNALYEWMGFDDNAQPVTTTLAEYLLVTAPEMPARIDFVACSTPTPLNALGVKGVGETGVLPMAAAIASAVEDALSPFGVLVHDAPLSPPRLLQLIEAARE
ncbi:MAG: hypothetical protein RLZ98_648 [Pseudomonadota bacterium]|jgi:carbon-monoxide dehydrogenase large subunit